MLGITILLSNLLVINAVFYAEKSVEDVIFNNYNRYEVIYTYLVSLSQIYPDRVNVSTIGISYAGRPILAVKISMRPHYEENRPIILIDAGMHAREWMAPAVALYLIHQLVQKQVNEYLMNGIDWVIIPLLNPDGYEFSHTHASTWRKTISNTAIQECSGVDINRNFDFHWLEYGSSRNECSPSYGGQQPFSEPETQALRNYAFTHKDNIKLYINLHAYASMIIFPWSYTQYPIYNEEEHFYLGSIAANAIEKVRGTHYDVGQTSSLLYVVAGSSCDWMAGVVGVPFNFGIELPKGKGRFQPPVEEIIPTGKETFEGFKAFQKYIRNKWPYSK